MDSAVILALSCSSTISRQARRGNNAGGMPEPRYRAKLVLLTGLAVKVGQPGGT